MRVHTCRHCGEVFPSYPDLRQHLDSHVQPPIGHICTTCKKSFTRREYLLKHSSRCRPKPFACDVCHSSFGRKQELNRHVKTVKCGGPPQPGPSAPKRRRIALNEDPVSPPPVASLDDELSSDLQDAVRENWGSIRTHVVHGPIQTRYNRRLTSLDTRDSHEQLRVLFDQQTTSFKINCSFAFILKEKQSGRLKYYHSSNNCCGRFMEEPALITNRADFDSFLERIREPDILQWAIAQRPNSDWVCEMATNVTFFLNRIVQHPLGCVGVTLPDYVKNNKAIVGLVKDHNRKSTYNDNLCLFRCLALHLMIIVDETIQEEGCDRTRKEVQGKSTDGTKIGEEMGQDGGRRKTYSAAVIDGIKRNSTTYVGDSIVRKTDTRLNKGEDVVVCFPGARIEHVTERVERIMGRGKGGTILVHVGTNNADKEGTTAIVEKYRELLKKTKQARVGQIIISGILPVFGNRIDGYRNSKRMAINGMTKRLCEEENVGYVDLWDSFVGIEELYARDGLHLSGKGAAAFAEGLSGAVASGLGKVRYLN